MRRRLIGILVTAVAVSCAPAAPAAGAGGEHSMQAVSGQSPFADGCGPNPDEMGLSDGAIDAEVEPVVAVNPSDSANIVVAWMQDYTQGLVVASTLDGGENWQQVVVPGTSTCSGSDYELAADPWLAFDAGGHVHLSGFSLDVPDVGPPIPFRTRWEVRSSADGGRTWSDPAVLARGELQAYDRPTIAADPRDSELLYALAYHMPMPPPDAFVPPAPSTTGVAFLRSEDRGRTWTLPQLIHVPAAPLDMVQLEVLPDGAIVAFAGIVRETYEIVALRSEDGGRSWSGPVEVARVAVKGCCGERSPESGDPVLAQDNFVSATGPDGTLYATYRDVTPHGDAVIRVTRSADGGLTWGSTQKPARTGARLAFLPAIAVSGENRIGVTFYDVRNDVPGDGEYSTDLWLARSADGGRTWVERHLAGPFDLDEAMLRRIPIEGLFLGDYQAIAGLPHGFAVASALARPLATDGASDIFFGRAP